MNRKGCCKRRKYHAAETAGTGRQWDADRLSCLLYTSMSAPLGVLLFILKSIDKNAEKEEKAAAQAQADYRSDLGPAYAQMAPRQEQDPEAACGTDRPTAEQKSAQNWHKMCIRDRACLHRTLWAIKTMACPSPAQ